MNSIQQIVASATQSTGESGEVLDVDYAADGYCDVPREKPYESVTLAERAGHEALAAINGV